jgi:hypothetical protein
MSDARQVVYIDYDETLNPSCVVVQEGGRLVQFTFGRDPRTGELVYTDSGGVVLDGPVHVGAGSTFWAAAELPLVEVDTGGRRVGRRLAAPPMAPERLFEDARFVDGAEFADMLNAEDEAAGSAQRRPAPHWPRRSRT